MGAPRAGATALQPADARYPGSPLRLEQGRYGEQAYAESKNRHPDPHTRSIHLHGMTSGPAADCVRLVSAALMTYSITACRTTSGGPARHHHPDGYQAIRAMRPRICRKRVPDKGLPASWSHLRKATFQ